MAKGYSELANERVSVAEGIDYAYRDTGGEGMVPLVLRRRHRGHGGHARLGARGHLKGMALADLRAAVEGKLGRGLDAQVLAPHPAGNPQKVPWDRPPVALTRPGLAPRPALRRLRAPP
jgi:hypothetical protein